MQPAPNQPIQFGLKWLFGLTAGASFVALLARWDLLILIPILGIGACLYMVIRDFGRYL